MVKRVNGSQTDHATAGRPIALFGRQYRNWFYADHDRNEDCLGVGETLPAEDAR